MEMAETAAVVEAVGKYQVASASLVESSIESAQHADYEICSRNVIEKIFADINEDMTKITSSFFDIGRNFSFVVQREKDLKEFYGFKDVFDFASKKYNLGKTAVRNYISVYNKFKASDGDYLDKRFEEIPFTKLVELIPLSDDKEVAKKLSVLTRSEIRAVKESESSNLCVEKAIQLSNDLCQCIGRAFVSKGSSCRIESISSSDADDCYSNGKSSFVVEGIKFLLSVDFYGTAAYCFVSIRNSDYKGKIFNYDSVTDFFKDLKKTDGFVSSFEDNLKELKGFKAKDKKDSEERKAKDKEQAEAERIEKEKTCLIGENLLPSPEYSLGEEEFNSAFSYSGKFDEFIADSGHWEFLQVITLRKTFNLYQCRFAPGLYCVGNEEKGKMVIALFLNREFGELISWQVYNEIHHYLNSIYGKKSKKEEKEKDEEE